MTILLTGRYRWTTLVAACALLLAPAAAGAQTDGDETMGDDMPTIVVSGSGEVRSAPDEAVVRLGVTAQAKTAGDAQAEVNRVAGDILRGVREQGISEEAVQTSRLSLYPVYAEQPRRTPQQEEPAEPEIVAYRASNVVSVRLEDLADVGPVIDAGIAAGANEVQGVDFRLRDDGAARRAALKAAVADARGRAEAIAAALGGTVGAVEQVNEGGVSVEMPRFDQRAMRVEAFATATPVAAGDVTVSASVTVRYRFVAGDQH